MTPHTTPDAATINSPCSFSASTDAAAENRPRRKSTTSTAVKRRYNATAYDTLQISIAKGGKRAIKDAAATAGLSTAAFIVAAINAYAGREIVPPLATNPYI